MPDLNIAFQLSFKDIYTPAGLKKLDCVFLEFIRERNKVIYAQIVKLRKATYPASYDTDFLVEAAPYVEDFLGELFSIQSMLAKKRKENNAYHLLYHIKKSFIQRQVAYTYKESPMENPADVLEKLGLASFKDIGDLEQAFALQVDVHLKHAQKSDYLFWAEQYAAWALHHKEGQTKHAEGILFKLPQKIYYDDLISNFIPRDRRGFNCTTAPIPVHQAMDQASYCLYCHKQDKDSCSKGFDHKVNSLGNTLSGCPLQQKISEMNQVKHLGYDVGALAIIMLDNPLAPLTGNRICNDCMKACIFQKQDPVDVPSVETQILQSVLSLPWGFEIYSLLCKWNPLKKTDYLPAKPQQERILVTGLGPAGIALSYYMLKEGYAVVGIDGLALRPLDDALNGWEKGNPCFRPIKTIQDFFEPLSIRQYQGFGGVAEYGITVRWDKNFLFVVRLMLERHHRFKCFGNTRLQSTLTIEQAFDFGFDHIALCLGAGRPNTLSVPGSTASGVRQASDFLMSLNLGAHKEESNIPLMIRLPVVVIGGGLTAVDTATEALAYYPIQVEKFLQNYEKSCREIGIEKTHAKWTEQEKEIALEFLAHAQMLRAYPHKQRSLLREWGGCTLVYRKPIQESRAYRLNHNELIKACEEGVKVLDNKVLSAIQTDSSSCVQQLLFRDASTFRAKTVLVATGTHPNTVLAEETTHIQVEGDFFVRQKDGESFYTVLTHVDQKKISLWGDLHPSYSGSVVKALASVKNHYKPLSAYLEKTKKVHSISEKIFFEKIEYLLSAKIVSVEQVGEDIFRMTVQAPAAVRNLKSGQLFRMQFPNEKSITLTGVNPNVTRNTVDFLLKKTHTVQRILDRLKPGNALPLMGPVGEGMPVMKGKKILLIGEKFEGTLLQQYAQFLKSENKVFSLVADKTAIEKLFDKYVKGDLQAPFYLMQCDYVYLSLPSPVLQKFQEKYKALFTMPAYATLFCPMQCMMKEICAQCIQQVIDPITGEDTFIYTCKNQNQPLQWIDMKSLQRRCTQNSILEKLSL